MAQQKPRRRHLQPQDADSGSGHGCLIWGGVLGIVVGAIFAFYGLKPILKHFYGETTIAAAATYTGHGKELRVTSVTTDANNPECVPAKTDPAHILCVGFAITSDKAWPDIEVNDFSLQISNQHDWIPGTALVGDGGTAPHVQANTPVNLSVHFPATIGGQAVDPEYLHLTSPRVRFALDE